MGKRSMQRLSSVTGEKLIQPTTANTPVKRPNQEDMQMLDSLCRIAGLAKLYSSLQRPSVSFFRGVTAVWLGSGVPGHLSPRNEDTCSRENLREAFLAVLKSSKLKTALIPSMSK